MNIIQDENYIDLIIPDRLSASYEPENVTNLDEEYSVLHLPMEGLDMCILGRYPYYSFPSIFTLESELSLEKSGIISLQQNPNFALFGQGMVVGFVDTGIDYQHTAFINADNTTRILAIWDQTITDGAPPENYGFGAEYRRERINVALKSDDPQTLVPTKDEIGHGTMMAGIAAGNENIEQNFSGVVPEAELLVVKLKQAKKWNRQLFGISEDAICYQETDLLLGVRYLVETARRMEKPIIICVGMGTSQGGHDSQGILSRYLDFLAQTASTGMVISAGNEGDKRRHFFGQMEDDVEFMDFELNVSEKDKSFSMEIWQSTPQRIAIEVTAPSGEQIERIVPTINECREFGLIFAVTDLWINNIILEEVTGDQMILVRFQNAQNGIWKFRIINLDGKYSEFNVWLPSGDLISRDTFLVNSTPDVTLTSPGNIRYSMVITAYNQNDSSILLESSHGYTRTGTVKPDLAAPGFEIGCTLPGGRYGTATGSGAAAAHTAGIVAMIMEWAVFRGNYTSITSRDINRLLIRGAYRQDNMTYPNPIWGYGEVDVLGAFRRIT